MNATQFPAASPAVSRLAASVLLSMGLHGGAALWLSPFPQGSGHVPDGSAHALTVLALPQSEDSKRSPADRQTTPRPIATGFEDEGPGFARILPRYFSLSELDRRPVALVSVNPVYPELTARHTKFVVLAILINEAGSVDRVVPVTDSPGDPFRESAVAAFSRARFSPGMRNGAAVKSRVLVEVTFESDPDDATHGLNATATPGPLSTAPNWRRHSIP
jgi:TonB family protein